MRAHSWMLNAAVICANWKVPYAWSVFQCQPPAAAIFLRAWPTRLFNRGTGIVNPAMLCSSQHLVPCCLREPWWGGPFPLPVSSQSPLVPRALSGTALSHLDASFNRDYARLVRVHTLQHIITAADRKPHVQTPARWAHSKGPTWHFFCVSLCEFDLSIFVLSPVKLKQDL